MRPYIPLFWILSISMVQAQNTLIDLKSISIAYEYEIRYATTHNFTGEKLYDCSKCLLQQEVAQALDKANQYFCELGYKIKLFDCYRPLSIQKRMWEKAPRATYIANPYGKGSVHNKAAAVDITLVTLDGCYVEMGTDYDHFGREAHIDNYDLPKEALENRKILIEGMRQFGFSTVRTEWWHFSFRKNWSYPTLDEPLPCD